MSWVGLNATIDSSPSVPNPSFEKLVDYFIAAIDLMDQLLANQFFSRFLKRRRGSQAMLFKKSSTVNLGVIFLHQSNQN